MIPVRESGAKNSILQLAEVVSWGSRLLVSANDYRFHQMHLKGRPRGGVTRFLSAPRGKELIWELNHEPAILEDKLLYENHFGAVGLPVPRTRALVGQLSVDQRERARDRPVLEVKGAIEFIREAVRGGAALVLKQLDGMLSKGVTVITGTVGGSFALSDGTSIDGVSLTKHLSSGSWLIQERVQQHPMLDSFAATSLNTIRLGTFRNADGSVDIEHAILRIGVSTAQTDAMWSGGMAVPLNVETGAFSDVAYRKFGRRTDAVWLHPETKVLFAGKVFPDWPQVISAAREFARHAGDNTYVGWDVAATPSGPLFTEGNHRWNISFAQLGSDGMLTDSFLSKYEVVTGRRINISELPRVRPIAALREFL